MSIRFDTSFKGALGRTCEAAGEEISRGLGAAAGAYAGWSPSSSRDSFGIGTGNYLSSIGGRGSCAGSQKLFGDVGGIVGAIAGAVTANAMANLTSANAVNGMLQGGFVMCAAPSFGKGSSGGITLYEPQGGGTTVNAEVGDFEDDAEAGKVTEDDLEAAKESLLAANKDLSPEDADEFVKMAEEVAGGDKAKLKRAVNEFSKLPSRRPAGEKPDDVSPEDWEKKVNESEAVWQEKYGRVMAKLHDLNDAQADEVVEQMFVPGDAVAQTKEITLERDWSSKGNLAQYKIKGSASPADRRYWDATAKKWYTDPSGSAASEVKEADPVNRQLPKPKLDGRKGRAKDVVKIKVPDGQGIADNDQASVEFTGDIKTIDGRPHDVYAITGAEGTKSTALLQETNGKKLYHDPYSMRWYKVAADGTRGDVIAPSPKLSVDGSRLVLEKAKGTQPRIPAGSDMAEINDELKDIVLDVKAGIEEGKKKREAVAEAHVQKFEEEWKNAIAYEVVDAFEYRRDGNTMVFTAKGTGAQDAIETLADEDERKDLKNVIAYLTTAPRLSVTVGGRRVGSPDQAASGFVAAAKAAAKQAKPEEKVADAPKEEKKADAPKEEKKADAPKEEKKADAPKEEKKADAPKEEKKADAPKKAEDGKQAGKDNPPPATYVDSDTTYHPDQPQLSQLSLEKKSRNGDFIVTNGDFSGLNARSIHNILRSKLQAEMRLMERNNPKFKPAKVDLGTLKIGAGGESNVSESEVEALRANIAKAFGIKPSDVTLKVVGEYKPEPMVVAQNTKTENGASFKKASDSAAQLPGAKDSAPEVKNETPVAKTGTKPSRTALKLTRPVDLTGKTPEEALDRLMGRVRIVSANTKNLLPSEIDVGTIKVDGNITEREFASMLDAIAAEYKIEPGEVFFSGKQGEFKPGLRAVDKPAEKTATSDKVAAYQKMFGDALKDVKGSANTAAIDGKLITSDAVAEKKRESKGNPGAIEPVKIGPPVIASSGDVPTYKFKGVKEHAAANSSHGSVADDAKVVEKAGKDEKKYVSEIFANKFVPQETMDKLARITEKHGVAEGTKIKLALRFKREPKMVSGDTPVTASVELVSSGDVKPEVASEVMAAMRDSVSYKMDERMARRLFERQEGDSVIGYSARKFDVTYPLPVMQYTKR